MRTTNRTGEVRKRETDPTSYKVIKKDCLNWHKRVFCQPPICFVYSRKTIEYVNNKAIFKFRKNGILKNIIYLKKNYVK